MKSKKQQNSKKKQKERSITTAKSAYSSLAFDALSVVVQHLMKPTSSNNNATTTQQWHDAMDTIKETIITNKVQRLVKDKATNSEEETPEGDEQLREEERRNYLENPLYFDSKEYSFHMKQFTAQPINFIPPAEESLSNDDLDRRLVVTTDGRITPTTRVYTGEQLKAAIRSLRTTIYNPLSVLLQYQAMVFTIEFTQKLYDLECSMANGFALQRQRWAQSSLIAYQLWSYSQWNKLLEMMEIAIFSLSLFPQLEESYRERYKEGGFEMTYLYHVIEGGRGYVTGSVFQTVLKDALSTIKDGVIEIQKLSTIGQSLDELKAQATAINNQTVHSATKKPHTRNKKAKKTSTPGLVIIWGAHVDSVLHRASYFNRQGEDKYHRLRSYAEAFDDRNERYENRLLVWRSSLLDTVLKTVQPEVCCHWIPCSWNNKDAMAVMHYLKQLYRFSVILNEDCYRAKRAGKYEGPDNDEDNDNHRRLTDACIYSFRSFYMQRLLRSEDAEDYYPIIVEEMKTLLTLQQRFIQFVLYSFESVYPTKFENEHFLPTNDISESRFDISAGYSQVV